MYVNIYTEFRLDFELALFNPYLKLHISAHPINYLQILYPYVMQESETLLLFLCNVRTSGLSAVSFEVVIFYSPKGLSF